MGLKDIVRQTKVWEDRYTLAFTDDGGWGYGFYLTGNPDDGFAMVPLTEGQEGSFEDALGRMVQGYWVTVRVENRGGWDKTPAHGTCACGDTVWLEHDYGHGIDCDCGRIYNQSGQELAPRSQWEDRYSEETDEPGSYDSIHPYNVEFGYIGPGDEY